VLQDLGVAPLLVVYDTVGNELDGAYVRLEVLQGKTDTFELAGHRLVARFFPDYDGAGGTRSRAFNNPALHLRAEAEGIEKTLRLGETLVLDSGSLRFSDLRFWVRMLVRKESGTWIVYTGFVIACIALIWRLVFYRREYVVALRRDDSQTRIDVGGRSELYRALFADEHETRMAALEHAMRD